METGLRKRERSNHHNQFLHLYTTNQYFHCSHVTSVSIFHSSNSSHWLYTASLPPQLSQTFQHMSCSDLRTPFLCLLPLQSISYLPCSHSHCCHPIIGMHAYVCLLIPHPSFLLNRVSSTDPISVLLSSLTAVIIYSLSCYLFTYLIFLNLRYRPTCCHHFHHPGISAVHCPHILVVSPIIACLCFWHSGTPLVASGIPNSSFRQMRHYFWLPILPAIYHLSMPPDGTVSL